MPVLLLYLAPHGLCDHLCERHSRECRGQPTVGGEHVNARLDQTDRFTKHKLNILLQLSRQRQPRQMRLSTESEIIHYDFLLVRGLKQS